MAKKIRFPLEMEQGVEVRSLDELRDSFSLARVLVYVSNRKLVTWLRDRYIDEIADAIECLDVNDSGFPKKVCEIFGIEYNEDITINIEKAEERNRRFGILKEYTTDKKFFDVVDNVAFTQDDIFDLLDERQNIIYLCGDTFTIPISKKGMTYIGINNPVVVVDVKEEVNWKEKEITLSGVRYDDKYQKIIEDADEKNRELIQGFVGTLNWKKPVNNSSMGGYSKDSYLNFMLSVGDKKDAEHCYNTLVSDINSVNYDIDADVSKVKQQLQNAGLVGLASNYIENL